MPRMRASTSRSSSRRNEIGLVDQDHVGEGDLILRFRRVLEPLGEPFGVGDGDDRIEPRLASDILVDEESLRHRRRIGEPGGLDDDGVELALPPHQPVEDAHQIAAHGAADAAIVHLEDFFVGADDEVVVDADLAEFIDDDGVFLAVRLGEDAVEQRGLAGAKVAGQHRDRDLVGRKRFGHARASCGYIGDPAAGQNPMPSFRGAPKARARNP